MPSCCNDKRERTTTDHRTGTREEWLAARLELLEAEKALTRRSDELARQRRELPRVRVEKEYRFDTDDGTRTLAELVDGRSQLLVYHFMFGPTYEAGCPTCSSESRGPRCGARRVGGVGTSGGSADLTDQERRRTRRHHRRRRHGRRHHPGPRGTMVGSVGSRPAVGRQRRVRRRCVDGSSPPQPRPACSAATSRGYSITSTGSGISPSHALKLVEPNIALAPFDDGVRIAGRFDLGRSARHVPQRRMRVVLRRTEPYLASWRSSVVSAEYAGFRPAC
jgi:hypothetical protein